MARKDPPEQLSLFAAAVVREADRRISWVAEHWPNYAAGQMERLPSPSAVSLWAESFPDLPKGSRALLLTLAQEAANGRSCRMCLPALAKANGMARNTCKRHLEKLLATGLVMMKRWAEPTSRRAMVLGYEFRLIIDLADRAAAMADGFLSARAVSRSPAGDSE